MKKAITILSILACWSLYQVAADSSDIPNVRRALKAPKQTRSPSPAPTTATPTTASPTSCIEDPTDTFFWKLNKNDNELTKTCDWLVNDARKKQRNDACDRTEKGPDSNLDPAKVVCKVTCGTCIITAAPTTATPTTAAPTTATPTASPTTEAPTTASPTSCIEDPTDIFFWKLNKNDSEIIKDCDWLANDAKNNQLNNACDRTEKGPDSNLDPAQVVCKVTCGTCIISW